MAAAVIAVPANKIPPADKIAPATRTSSLGTSTLQVARRALLRYFRTPQLIVLGTLQGALFLLIFRYVFGGAVDIHGTSYVNFLVPGFVMTGVLFSGQGAATGVAEDLQQGFVDRLRSLPVPRACFLAGRAIADSVWNSWGLLVATAVGLAVGFRPHGSVAADLGALGLCIVFGFAFEWLFILVGLLSGSPQAAQGMAFLVFPLTFVSSAYVPVSSMPGWLQAFAQHQPVTYMVDAVRALTLGGTGPSLGHSVGYFTLWSLVWSAGAVLVFAPLAAARYRRLRPRSARRFTQAGGRLLGHHVIGKGVHTRLRTGQELQLVVGTLWGEHFEVHGEIVPSPVDGCLVPAGDIGCGGGEQPGQTAEDVEQDRGQLGPRRVGQGGQIGGRLFG